MKCEKCDREFTEEEHRHPGKIYKLEQKILCESCVVDMGVSIEDGEPWTYIKTRTDLPT